MVEDEPMNTGGETVSDQLVENSRVQTATQLLNQYPIEQYEEWYKTNHPEIYAGYSYNKNKVVNKPVTEQSSNLKSVLIILGILAVFAIIVVAVLFGFLGQANEFLNF